MKLCRGAAFGSLPGQHVHFIGSDRLEDLRGDGVDCLAQLDVVLLGIFDQV
jgi:hypothetical protein